MSRNIIQNINTKKVSSNTCKGKVIITKYREKEIVVLFDKNRIQRISVIDTQTKVGAIYIGKIKNIVSNLNACFVEIADKEICYLPFAEAEHPILLNRCYDGRLLQGDEILVKVQKDAIKTKQAVLTCKISVQNNYFVFMSGSTKNGVSNKLPKDIRKQILTYIEQNNLLLSKYVNNEKFHYSCIVRTEAGEIFQKDTEEFKDIFCKSQQEFITLIEASLYKLCFSCIKQPKTSYEDIINQFCEGFNYDEVITDVPNVYSALKEIGEYIRFYEDPDLTLSKLYRLESGIDEAVNKMVWLSCGANMVIEQTECLTTIDVNSSKMSKGKEKSASIYEINVEAAYEAAFQIRLRNLSGIIIIDFINMENKVEEEKLISLMKELTSDDIVTTSVIDITPLGLMEITRKKVCKSLREQFNMLN